MTTDLVRSVSKILFEFDPMDLRRVDVPEDEYDSEAEMITKRVMAGSDFLHPYPAPK